MGPRQCKVPPEVTALKKGQISFGVLGIDFVSASDKEGGLHARLDIKSDRGSNTVDLKPSLAELVRRCKMSKDDFQTSMARLQGFQRVTSSFTLSGGEAAHKALPEKIRKQTALVSIIRGKCFC
jgi:hypothetical protein